jgi:hypothetical protein
VRAECDNLYLFVDGQLGQAEAARFREHLAGCRRCPTALENALVLDAIAEQGLIGGQQLGHTIEVPAVVVAFASRPAPRPRSRLPLLVGLAALVLAVALAAGWWLLG